MAGDLKSLGGSDWGSRLLRVRSKVRDKLTLQPNTHSMSSQYKCTIKKHSINLCGTLSIKLLHFSMLLLLFVLQTCAKTFYSCD